MRDYINFAVFLGFLGMMYTIGYMSASDKYKLIINEIQITAIEKHNKYLEEKDRLVADHAIEMEKLKSDHIKEIDEIDKEHNSAIADVASDYRLLDKGNVLVTAKYCDTATYTCTFRATDSGVKLSKEATIFLLNLTREADGDRANLNLCKKTLQNIYKAVDEQNAAAIKN